MFSWKKIIILLKNVKKIIKKWGKSQKKLNEMKAKTIKIKIRKTQKLEKKHIV